ncbi:MAG: phenylalanine--tRNA ligase subunit beta [Paludibacteraceae bacterium]|nr:phenylalanine--tRNA ligase subunit beta [Paludibacteraceae bacterium]
MNISYKWLKRYIDLKDDAETVAKILTSIGLEVGTVEQVESIKGGLQGLVVGEVLSCIPHPNSDHLHITQTRLAPDADPVQIVCGAANVAAGQKVIVATVGTKLYQGDECITIKRGKIRGEESLGMICAEDEIGVGSSHEGIMVLPADTPVGLPAAKYFHLENDTVIEVDITPNRSDAASHYGVARDLHAYYVAHALMEEPNDGNDPSNSMDDVPLLSRPDVSGFKVDHNDLPITVTIENPQACPRYTGVSIKGVTVKESPEWLKNALNTIGLRSINNIVDITNFVLHENGQALHAFDADKITGRHIIVKNARQGEKFVTLDGTEREMDAKDLMICNENGPMCIAGVFGGLESGVTEKTQNVFLESAYFDPVSIRKTARRHQLSTDASFRYERGCDPNNTLYVLKRAATLIQEVAGGEISMDIVDFVDGKPASQQDSVLFEPWKVELNINRINQLIGKQISKEVIEGILAALDIEINDDTDGTLLVGVPRYRVDVQRECDVVEDILRIYGYNNIEFPEKLNSNLSFNPKPNPVFLQTRISEQLTAQGFREILNNSLTKTSYYQRGTWMESCVKIKNPLSQDLGVMRQTLLFGGLESIQRNQNRKNADLKFYEFGNCYHYNRQAVEGTDNEPIAAYTEEPHLGMWITGNRNAQTWMRKDEKVSFYLLHAYVNNVLRRLGVNLDRVILEPAIDPEKECCCGICECFADGLVIKTQANVILGYMAVVKRDLLKQFDIDGEVFYADLYWKQLIKQDKQYKPIIEDLPKFPEVKRDFALLVDKNILFADLKRAARETEKKLLKNVYLFDVYEGKNLEEGKKSYALSFILQDKENTLTDQKIDAIMGKLQHTFESKFNAKLR